MGECFEIGYRGGRPPPSMGPVEAPMPPISPTERLRQMKTGLNSQKVRLHKKVDSLKPGSDSCYSRSEHSSTSDSESARLPPAIADRLAGEAENGAHGGDRPPARGEVRLATQGQPMSRLERLCPRVRSSAPRPSYDSTSLSSVDTSTLSTSSSP